MFLINGKLLNGQHWDEAPAIVWLQQLPHSLKHPSWRLRIPPGGFHKTTWPSQAIKTPIPGAIVRHSRHMYPCCMELLHFMPQKTVSSRYGTFQPFSNSIRMYQINLVWLNSAWEFHTIDLPLVNWPHPGTTWFPCFGVRVFMGYLRVNMGFLRVVYGFKKTGKSSNYGICMGNYGICMGFVWDNMGFVWVIMGFPCFCFVKIPAVASRNRSGL